MRPNSVGQETNRAYSAAFGSYVHCGAAGLKWIRISVLDMSAIQQLHEQRIVNILTLARTASRAMGSAPLVSSIWHISWVGLEAAK